MNKCKLNTKRHERGFSLLVALIFVAFFGTVLTTFVYNTNNETLQSEAEITGWQAAKIARAARIYVRNQTALNPNLKFALDIAAAGPQVVPFAALSANALISADIARQDGGQAFTALGHEIVVIMANYPVDGNPNLDTTIPTAYVHLRGNDRTDPSLIQDIVAVTRRQDVALSAPIFNGGVNMSGTCNGLGDAVAIWDTGCLGEVEFTALTGEASFIPGSLLIPAWRAVNFDARVLMRFPQPETVGMTTMLTELEMGDPLADCDTNVSSRIAIPSDVAGTVSDLCGAMNDDVSAANIADADHRRDILGANNIQGSSYVSYSQGGLDVTISTAGVRSNATTDEDYALDVGQNTIATGDMKVFGDQVEVVNTTNVDRNTLVSTQTAGKIMSANIGNGMIGDGLSTETLEIINTVTTGSNISANQAVVSPSSNVNGALVSQQMQMATGNSSIAVSNSASMLGTTSTSTTNITGTGNAGGYSYVSGDLNAVNLQTNGNAVANNTVAVQGATQIFGALNISNGGGSANCLGDCPEREQFCINQGALNYDECMSVNGWN